jgi:hypothetical protein
MIVFRLSPAVGDAVSTKEQFDADAGSAGVGRCGSNRNLNPIGIVMAREAGRIPIG